MQVSVAWALSDEQAVVHLSLAEGATAAEAIHASGLSRRFPEFDPDHQPIGIYGRVVAPEQVLEEGDRVEIYRPLQIDPREARRRLAATGRSMGRRGPPGR